MRIEFRCLQDNMTVEDLLKHNNVSRRLITKLKRTKNGIALNSLGIRTIDKLKVGDVIVISIDDTHQLEANPNLKAEIVYEDSDLIVFNKPYDMPVHPSIKHQGDTLGNYFSAVCSGLTFRPVNRLDRNTSGLCVVAKNAYAAKALSHAVKKTYYAVVSGVISDSGTISQPIARESDSIIKRCVRCDGQTAVTHYEPIKMHNNYTLVKINLETGRTHQIRVHFSFIGYPLAGDSLYGGDCTRIERQALHCGMLIFTKPLTHEKIILSAKLPNDMSKLIDY